MLNRPKKMQVPNKYSMVAQVTLFSKVIHLILVLDVKNDSVGISQPNTSSTLDYSLVCQGL
jgi:hypothetical protein